MMEENDTVLERAKSLAWEAESATRKQEAAMAAWKAVRKEVEESGLGAVMKGRLAEYKPQWKRIVAKGERLSEGTNSEYEDFVTRVFRASFKHIKGKPLEIIGKKPGWNWKLVVAPYGFGRRYNVHASLIDGYDTIMELVQKRQEVCDALDAVGLAKWAKKFAAFCDALPKGGGERFVSRLSKPVVGSRWAHGEPEVADSAVFRSGSDEIEVFAQERGYEIGDVDLAEPSASDAVIISQMLPDIPRILGEFEANIDEALAQVAKARKTLEDGFGRDLLISEV